MYKNKQLLVLYLTLTMITILISGCCNKNATLSPRIQIENSTENDFLKLDHLVTNNRGDGLIEIEAKFFNFGPFGREFTYKIEWIDNNNLIKETILSRWNSVFIKSGSTILIKGISPASDIKDYNIKIHLPMVEEKLNNENNN